MQKQIHKKRAIIKAATVATLCTIIVAFCAFAPKEETTATIYTAAVEQSDKPAQNKPIEAIEEPEEKPEEKQTYWAEIPLDADVQNYIVRKCEELEISPSVVFAMIWRESRYQADAIGDNGAALGLLQVWPRWHGERMDKLGVTNLLDPLQNVIVGMDYLAELLDRGNGLEWAVAAYNKGATGANKLTTRGIKSEYAASVLAEAERIEANVFAGLH